MLTGRCSADSDRIVHLLLNGNSKDAFASRPSSLKVIYFRHARTRLLAYFSHQFDLPLKLEFPVVRSAPCQSPLPKS